MNTEVFNPTPDDAPATRRSLAVEADQKLLLYVGRLAKEKNTQTLFRTFELLRLRDRNKFHLLVIGDGPQRHTVQKLRQSRSCGRNISWISYCADSADLARYYRAADLFVHPSVQETFGLVALESQACGTPVVGIRGSYMDRVICHDQESWAGENTPEALAGAIEAASTTKLSSLGAIDDQTGAVLSTAPMSIPAGQRVSVNTASLGVARNRTGTARLAHDGPPGSILVEAAIANFSISPAYVQPVKFQPVRERR